MKMAAKERKEREKTENQDLPMTLHKYAVPRLILVFFAFFCGIPPALSRARQAIDP